MKKLRNLFLAASVFGLVSCEKVKQVADFNNLGIGSYLTLNKTNNALLNFADINNTGVSFVVSEKGSPVDKITVYVTEGASKQRDKSKWKKVKDVTYTAPETTIAVKATEIAAALGIPATSLKPGVTYMLYQSITTKDGVVYDLANTVSGYESNANYNMALTFPAIIICPFVPTGFPGKFIVTEDGWGDYAVGEEVTVNSANANTVNLTAYPSDFYGAVNRKPIDIKVVETTGAASVATQGYGDYPQFGLLGMTVTSSGTNNWVFSCSGNITLLLTHNNNQGTYRLSLKKK